MISVENFTLRIPASFLILILSLVSLQIAAQKPTKVSGQVIDAQTKQPLAFVNVYFLNTDVGVTTDLDGKYDLNTRWASDTIVASFLGYNTQYFPVELEEKQNIDFTLKPTAVNLERVTIKATKEKYSKKNNPAVDLIKKVMANKGKNSLDGKDFYSYDKYEKVELDINNITDEFRNRRIFKNFEFIFNYVDTSEINGKPYLPMFLREINSTVYYRKEPEATKEYRHAVKYTDFHESIDEKSISDVIDLLYHDVDIYDNTIDLLDNQFVSPLAPIAINFYRFYIMDTIAVAGDSLINLAFIPRNKANVGFTGNLFISHDGRYTVRKVDMTIIGGINLNFVRDMKIIQEYDQGKDSSYVLTKDYLLIDYAISKNSFGFFGTRTVSYENFSFEPAEDPDVYGGFENTIVADGAYERDDAYWSANRMDKLSDNEEELYAMVDSLKNTSAYKKLVYIVQVFATGFVPVGPMDLGPIPVTASFNEVEGFRVRLGGETNFNFSKRLLFEIYGAYGFKDETFKYASGITYTFREDFKANPKHHVHFSYSKESTFPGQNLAFFQNDNFLLSFKRGNADQMLLEKTYLFEYLHEGLSFDFSFIFENRNRLPYGRLDFSREAEDGIELVESVQTSEFGLMLRFAPNEQFIQGRQYRTPIINEFPVITFNYRAGIKDLLGGEYNYHRFQLNLFKRFNWSVFGHTNIEVEMGKVFGQLPYVLLHLPKANQSYSYQIRSYNLMNFMEFASDQYVGVNLQHFPNGYFFNKIPLFKKLKLREVLTFKMLYGSLRDENIPDMNPGLIMWPTDPEGNTSMFTLENEPYIEASFGFINVFRILRIDLVKRFNYLDHPNVPGLWGVKGLGIRGRFRVEF